MEGAGIGRILAVSVRVVAAGLLAEPHSARAETDTRQALRRSDCPLHMMLDHNGIAAGRRLRAPTGDVRRNRARL